MRKRKITKEVHAIIFIEDVGVKTAVEAIGFPTENDEINMRLLPNTKRVLPISRKDALIWVDAVMKCSSRNEKEIMVNNLCC